MDLRSSRWITWLAAVFVAALLVVPATAFAGEDDTDTGDETTKSTTTVIGTKEGKRTIHVTTGKDGRVRLLAPDVVIETEEATDDEGEDAEAVVRMVISDADGEKKVRTLRLKDGTWVAVPKSDAILVEDPSRFIHPSLVLKRGAPAAGQAAKRSPISTIFKWLMGGSTDVPAHGCPFQAWFDGGPDVPLAGLRDALKADGWTGAELGKWAHSNLGGLLMRATTMPQPRIHAPVRVQRPRFGPWFDADRPSCRGNCSDSCRPTDASASTCGCGGCRAHVAPRQRGCGCGRGMAQPRACGCQCGQCPNARPPRVPMPGRGCGCGQGPGVGFAPPSGVVTRQMHKAYVIWNDGTGWHQREIDGPPGAVASPRMPFPMPMPRTERRCPDCSGAGRSAPALPPGLELPPEALEVLRGVFGGRAIQREVEVVETVEEDGTARAIAEGLKLLPPDLIERVPPEVLESVMKEMKALGLGELVPPSSDCDTCPKRGSCGGGCQGKGDGGTCPKQGSCDGDCSEDCPGKKDGSCGGDCDTCPNKGSCGGDCGGNCKRKAEAK